MLATSRVGSEVGCLFGSRNAEATTQAQIRMGSAVVRSGTDGRPCLLGKGCLIHVEAETIACETIPPALGREPGDAATSLFRTGEGDRHGEGDGSGRSSLDAPALRAGDPERRRPGW